MNIEALYPRSACFAAVLLAAAGLTSARASGGDEAVTTLGQGELTMCRSWVVYQSCNTYHRIKLPQQIAIGDDVPVIFGSNNKEYKFHVTDILRDGERCKILSTASDPKGDGERIEANCQPKEKPAAAPK
jgi:hypothetical protein